MPPRALIFDFDGTLAELNLDFAAIKAEVEGLARSRGLDGEWPGQGYLLEQVDAVASAMGDGFRAAALALIQERELEAAGRGRLFPYTPGLLARAREQGLALAVISRNCGPAIRRVFPGVDEAVDAFLPREAVARPKPDPDHLAQACRALGVEPAQAVAVGDHPLDVAGALAAGIRAVAVASGRIGQAELARSGAEMVLSDAAGLLDALMHRPPPRARA